MRTAHFCLNSAQPPSVIAGEGLYRKHSDLVFRVCLKYLRNGEEAREAAQEAFYKAIKGLPDFAGQSQTGTWIYRIAVNECLSRIDNRNRERQKREKFAEEAPIWEDARDENDAFAGRLVEEVLENLPGQTRKVVWLCLGEGLTHAEIAASLGVSRVAVTRRITRFLRHAQLWRSRWDKREQGYDVSALEAA